MLTVSLVFHTAFILCMIVWGYGYIKLQIRATGLRQCLKIALSATDWVSRSQTIRTLHCVASELSSSWSCSVSWDGVLPPSSRLDGFPRISLQSAVRLLETKPPRTQFLTNQWLLSFDAYLGVWVVRPNGDGSPPGEMT